MDTTPNLALPFIAPSQAQKHVTHNEAIRALDALVQISVEARNVTAPPPNPAEGLRYMVSDAPAPEWAGQANKIAAYQDGAWVFYTPQTGWIVWSTEDSSLLVWDGSGWSPATSGSGGGGSLNPADLVGVNTTADTVNRLAISSPSTLFSHEGADHRLNINKSTQSDTASVVFQTGFSGRAEFGLTGDDNWRVKVSADGNNWLDALVVDKTTGAVEFPNTPVQSSNPAVYFLGYASDPDAVYREDDFVSLSSNAANGGADSHGSFDASSRIYTVPETGLYNCVAVTHLRTLPEAGRGGIYMAKSQDNGTSWTNIFRSFTNTASTSMSSNAAFVNLDQGDLVAVRGHVPANGTAQYFLSTRLALYKMA